VTEKTYFDELRETGVPDTIPKDLFAFEDLFDEFYVKDCGKTWSHDRNESVGASEAFGCMRKSWFGKRGKDHGFLPDPDYRDSWGAVRRGDLIENYQVVPAIRSGLARRGLDLIMEGEDQKTIVDGVSSATLDGLIIDPTGAKLPVDFLAAYGIEEIDEDSLVVEMKSFDPRINITEPKAIHEGQTHMQMGLIRETTDYKPNYAVVIYINASWLDDIRIYVVPFDESIYQIGRKRAEQVFVETDPAMLHAEGKLDGMCAYCPFKRSCDEVSVSRVPEKRKALTKKEEKDQEGSYLVQQLDEKVRAHKVLKGEEKALKRKVEESNEDIRQTLIRSNQSRAVGHGWKVSYTTIAGRKTLSKELMIEDGLDPGKYMNEGSGYEKLTVTMDGASED